MNSSVLYIIVLFQTPTSIIKSISITILELLHYKYFSTICYKYVSLPSFEKNII